MEEPQQLVLHALAKFMSRPRAGWHLAEVDPFPLLMDLDGLTVWIYLYADTFMSPCQECSDHSSQNIHFGSTGMCLRAQAAQNICPEMVDLLLSTLLLSMWGTQ